MKLKLDHKIYEFKLNNGDTIMADVLDTSGDQFVVCDPLQIVMNPAGKWVLQKYFHTTSERWVVLHETVITAMCLTDDSYINAYYDTVRKAYGPIEDTSITIPEGSSVH